MSGRACFAGGRPAHEGRKLVSMLSPVVRHGFLFWEAKRSTKAPYEETAQQDDEMERMREKARKWADKLSRDFKKHFATPRGRAAALKELRNRYNRKWWGELAELSNDPPPGSPEEADDKLVKGTAMGLGFKAGIEIQHIQERVMAAFRVSADDLLGGSQNHQVGRARMASMALCRAHTLCTVEEIADAHGRHYSLVVKAQRWVSAARERDAFFDLALKTVEGSLLALEREAMACRN